MKVVRMNMFIIICCCVLYGCGESTPELEVELAAKLKTVSESVYPSPESDIRLFLQSVKEGDMHHAIQLARELFSQDFPEHSEKAMIWVADLHEKLSSGNLVLEVAGSMVEEEMAVIVFMGVEDLQNGRGPSLRLDDEYFINSNGGWSIFHAGSSGSDEDKRKKKVLREWYEENRDALKKEAEKEWYSRHGIYREKLALDRAIEGRNYNVLAELALHSHAYISSGAMREFNEFSNRLNENYDFSSLQPTLEIALSDSAPVVRLNALKMLEHISNGYDFRQYAHSRCYDKGPEACRSQPELPEYIGRPFYVELFPYVLQTVNDPSPGARLRSVELAADILIRSRQQSSGSYYSLRQFENALIERADDTSAEVRDAAYRAMADLGVNYDVHELDEILEKGMEDENR